MWLLVISLIPGSHLKFTEGEALRVELEDTHLKRKKKEEEELHKRFIYTMRFENHWLRG